MPECQKGAAQNRRAAHVRYLRQQVGVRIMRITALTCVKNEGPFLLEWIAFNRVIGVTDFLFYHNDCTDGTDRLTPEIFAKLARARREDRQYLRNLLRHLDDKGRTKLAHALCKNVTTRMDGVPAFERRLKGLETRLAELEGADS